LIIRIARSINQNRYSTNPKGPFILIPILEINELLNKTLPSNIIEAAASTANYNQFVTSLSRENRSTLIGKTV
jgi:hypothetical protein